MLNSTAKTGQRRSIPGPAQRTVLRLRSGRSPRLAGEALPGFWRGCNRRMSKSAAARSRRLLHPRQVPGRLWCQARRTTRPATATGLETPARANPSRTDTPDRSLSRCPPEAAVDFDLPHHDHDAGSRRGATNRPPCAWRTTGGRTTFSRGSEASRARVERVGGWEKPAQRGPNEERQRRRQGRTNQPKQALPRQRLEQRLLQVSEVVVRRDVGHQRIFRLQAGARVLAVVGEAEAGA